ncbi:hypothetical protein QMA09_02450 [Planococcus sp. APC 3906]|uniref:hypothetical protein n=1 Tax=Planococcus sp. APC 3906 TaxID=3035194 RepID=UPI0025B30B02|nr:hypothetical protein [Planococcus sp. APC 3906]MDN3449032.1 hypothetical protein [Planococcus sp. APC 3906]
MAELMDKEQVLMAYYAQYYREASTDEVRKLDARLSEGLGEARYAELMEELIDEGLAIGMAEVEKREQQGSPAPMATNEGMLYINNVLNLQSYAVEENQLDYLQNHLETSGLELTLEPVKSYIQEVIDKEADEEPNSNRP